ncbi:MAG: hypothetical protein ACOY0T_04495 [Myxococcota bacterium]
MSDSDESRAAKPRASNEASTRTLLKVGAVTAALGIALAVADDEGIARWLTLAGIVLLIMGLHRFGRLGSDTRWRRDATNSMLED